MWMTVFYAVALIVSIIYISGFIYKRKSGVCTCQNKLHGKTIIITGASAGIGKEAAFDFAERGARVVLACRNLEKAQKVKEWIVRGTGNKDVVCRHLELSELDSVRRFVEETLEEETRLDVLVNNAALGNTKKILLKQNYEQTLAVNHYGHFLLTNLLLDFILKSKPSRIINVSSSSHSYGEVDLNDLHFKFRPYSLIRSYSQSKLCNVLFTNELNHRLRLKGIKSVTVNSMHPGAVETEFLEKVDSHLFSLGQRLRKPLLKDSKLGAQTIIHLAVSDKVKNVSGEYFVDCKIAEMSETAKDRQLAIGLWKVSEKEVGLSQDEKYI